MPIHKDSTTHRDISARSMGVALYALRVYAEHQGLADDGLETQMSDLIADFAHLCERSDVNFAAVIDRAEGHYDAEYDALEEEGQPPYGYADIEVYAESLGRPTSDMKAVLLEFIKDVEAVGRKQTAQDWPDIVVTYAHAIEALGLGVAPEEIP